MQNTLFPKFALYRLRLLERQEIETNTILPMAVVVSIVWAFCS